jgi:hypothetical protein
MYNAQSLSSATWGNNVIVIRNKVSGDTTTARSVLSRSNPITLTPKSAIRFPGSLTAARLINCLGSFNRWNLKSKALNTAPQTRCFPAVEGQRLWCSLVCCGCHAESAGRAAGNSGAVLESVLPKIADTLAALPERTLTR